MSEVKHTGAKDGKHNRSGTDLRRFTARPMEKQNDTRYYPASGMFHGAVPAMNSRLDVLLFGNDETFLDRLFRRIAEVACGLHRMLNRFDPGSPLNRLRRAATGQSAELDDRWWNLLFACDRCCRLSEGLFDITKGAASAWELDEPGRTLRLSDEGVEFDFGACAKGYLLDEIRAVLQKNEITRAFVNFGNSSVLALGTHPLGDCWPVGIAHPYRPAEVLDTVRLCDNALSVSGNMPTHPVHIVDPRTGRFCTGRKLAAVVARDAFEAEVLSTALIPASADEARRISRRFVIEQYKQFNT